MSISSHRSFLISLGTALHLSLAVASVSTARAVAESTVSANPFLHSLGADGTARFEITDHIKHPHFWWPRTLLNYRVAFDPAKSSPDQWRLTDAQTGKVVPCQISDVKRGEGNLAAATVSFFSDLPSGASRAFLLKAAGGPGPAPEVAVRISDEADALVVDTGAIKVRLPASREIRSGAEAPGPIMALDDGRGWVGSSRIVSPRRAVQKIVTEVLDRGPLFARVRVAYTFAGNGTYTAILKLPAGYTFVELLERMDGITKEEGVAYEIAWTGLPLTHRRGGEGIDKPHTLYFRGEDPHFIGPEGVEDPAKEFYFRLGHVAADNTIHVTAADFTNRENGRAVGLGILDAANWDDHEYAIWAANESLSVRFRYVDKVLHWNMPLVTGSRHLAVSAFDNARAGTECGEPFRRWQGTSSAAAASNTGVAPGKSWISFVNSRYGGMSLDVIKDWQLSYPDDAPRPSATKAPHESENPPKAVDGFLKALWEDSECVKVEGNWISPVSMRIMSKWVLPAYLRFRGQMTPEDRRKVEALLLFHAYHAAREEISPVRHMLKGHPNFMTDWKYPLMAGAFLFPAHPMAREWADQFEKTIELMGVFYVRPPVEDWQANGGRWTESIGVYNWAFIQPGIFANELGRVFDGQDRWPGDGMALHARYLSGIVTAPVKLGKAGEPFNVRPGVPLTLENGFQRIHPPQGAHAGRRAIPAVAENFGTSLLRYSPMSGEYLLWASQRPPGSTTGIHGEAGAAAATQRNLGTNPRLSSAKYTGYGIVMRAAVDTPEEISVFLQQIDKGPNYRWGLGNEGGCGDVYYYAAGKSYAGHLGEDAGDRRVTDAELTCNTGVYKDYTFRGIGMNELTEPFYNLESAQFAELLPRQGPDAYSWPEYTSRAVMLVGHDYIITFDAVNGMSRMSWNTVKGEDEMPVIIPIRGETAFRTYQTSDGARFGTSESLRFEPYKGGGDRMALISHRKEVTVAKPRKEDPKEVTVIRTPEHTDTLLINRDTFEFGGDGLRFAGRAGVIRKPNGKSSDQTPVEIALFHGSEIGVTGQLLLSVDNPDLGISARFTRPEECNGVFFSRAGGTLVLTFGGALPEANRFFVDGQEVATKREEGRLFVKLPSGEHRWQLTAGPVEPMPPQILRSESQADGAKLFITPVASAKLYRVERSDDNGLTWKAIGTTSTPEYTLAGVQPPAKVHIRAVALNGKASSRPGRDYPVYVTGKPPEPPDGLRLGLAKDQVSVRWGEVLGVKGYILHRRRMGEEQWDVVYRGTETHFTDKVLGVIPAYSEPGLASAADRAPVGSPVVFEYAVSAEDGVGEGNHSKVANTDPASWRNWYPATPLVFKRQSAYWLPPYVSPEEVPPPHYPK